MPPECADVLEERLAKLCAQRPETDVMHYRKRMEFQQEMEEKVQILTISQAAAAVVVTMVLQVEEVA